MDEALVPLGIDPVVVSVVVGDGSRVPADREVDDDDETDSPGVVGVAGGLGIFVPEGNAGNDCAPATI